LHSLGLEKRILEMSSYKRTRGLAVKYKQLFRLFGGEVTLTCYPITNADIPFGYFSNPDHLLVAEIVGATPLSLS
jgi:hypothetical protein